MEVQLLSDRFSRAVAGRSVMPLSEKQQQFLTQLVAALTRRDLTLIPDRCPCQPRQSRDVAISETDRYGLELTSVLCRACGTVRIDPYFDEQSLNRFYRDFYQDMYGRSRDLAHLFDYQCLHYGERIAALYASGLDADSNVLEVGCGTGGATRAFRDRGCFVAGCDLSQPLIEYGTSRGLSNLWNGTIETAPSSVAHKKYDLIYLFHVLEHVAEPVQTLRDLAAWLKPDGRILAVVPNLAGIDAHRNPAGNALIFLHVAHKYNYTAAGLATVAAQAGCGARRIAVPRHDQPVQDARDLAELWMEFSPGEHQRPEALPDDSGDRMLRYLLDTEQAFLAGKCSAQLEIAGRRALEGAASKLPIHRQAKKVAWIDKVPLLGMARKVFGFHRTKGRPKAGQW